VEARMRDNEITLLVSSSGEVDLEEWRAARTGDVFRQIYNRSLNVARPRMTARESL
jgi:hypothetical protein